MLPSQNRQAGTAVAAVQLPHFPHPMRKGNKIACAVRVDAVFMMPQPCVITAASSHTKLLCRCPGCPDHNKVVRQALVAVVRAGAAMQGRHAARELAGAAGAGARGEAHRRFHDGGAAAVKATPAVWGGCTPAIAVTLFI